MCACQHVVYLLQSACVHVRCVCLQLWGTIDHVEAPGPSELVHFKANSKTQQATAEQLTCMGQQVGPAEREQGGIRHMVRFPMRAGFGGLSTWWQQDDGSGHSTWPSQST
jgi:hypothetical protein